MSETPNGLYPALLAAQTAMGPVKKDANNPAFRTKYATLLSVLETVEGPLADNGLVLLQRFDVGEGGPVLITEIVHAASGQSITSALPIVSKDPTDPQKLGGAITYARRYSLLALLGLAPEDDDGNSAAQPRPQSQQQPRPTQPQRPAEPRNAPAAPEPLTDLQQQAVDAAWDMAGTDTLAAIKALLLTLKPHATPGQWKTISAELVKIQRKHYTQEVPA